MNKDSDDTINIRLLFHFDSPIKHLSKEKMLMLLHYYETSKLPKPVRVTFSGNTKNRMRHKKVSQYLDVELLKILELKDKTGNFLEINADEDIIDCSLTFFRVSKSQGIVIQIRSNWVALWGITYIKQLFMDLVNMFPETRLATCYFSSYYLDFYKKYIEANKLRRAAYFPILVWLQYIGASELVIHGGMPFFEAHPSLKTQRLHDGLLVEVGDSPYDVFTKEGDAFLAEATMSLPAVIYQNE